MAAGPAGVPSRGADGREDAEGGQERPQDELGTDLEIDVIHRLAPYFEDFVADESRSAPSLPGSSERRVSRARTTTFGRSVRSNPRLASPI
ncbi:hypothetical protein GCM10010439_18730 [Actinocorallia aurantiaca]|uniref:Uncharacterized protein n=1 Tax=Actinocorallia aurantiaca TaxID=46204 RepID=A0ABN3U306_9ACTN